MTKPKGQSRVSVGARQFQNNKKRITAVWQCKSWQTCLSKSTTCSGCIPYDDLDTHQGDKDSFDHCLVSNWEGLVRVSLLWDKQHQTAIVRKNTSIEDMKNLKFGVDRANIEQDSAIYNLKIYKRCMDCRTHCPDVYIFLSKFWSFWMYVSRSI